jgi:Na+/citrate or Na+/malate symporter
MTDNTMNQHIPNLGMIMTTLCYVLAVITLQQVAAAVTIIVGLISGGYTGWKWIRDYKLHKKQRNDSMGKNLE